MSSQVLSEDDEEDELEEKVLKEEITCPSCQKKKKNVLLHIKKSDHCKNKVSNEELKEITDQSNKIRRMKVRLNKARSRKKANEKQKLKIQEEQPAAIWNSEDGSCPICREKKKNVLLHLKKSHVCKANVSSDQMNALIFNSEAVARVRVKKYKEKKKQMVKNEIDQVEENMHTENFERFDEKPICDQSEADSSEEEVEETMKEMQNRWKAKSREKARKKDHNALKKYQRENTAKCRKKQKQEDIELY